MEHKLSLSDRACIRRALLERGDTLESWARAHGHSGPLVHRVITRYGGTEVDMLRPWGPATRAVIADLASEFSAPSAGAPAAFPGTDAGASLKRGAYPRPSSRGASAAAGAPAEGGVDDR